MAVSYRAHIHYRQSGVTYRGALAPALLEGDDRYRADRPRTVYRALRGQRRYRTTSAR